MSLESQDTKTEDEHDAKAAAVRSWLGKQYPAINIERGEVDVVYDGEEHWVFEIWAGEAYKSQFEGTGYIHPGGNIEGLY